MTEARKPALSPGVTERVRQIYSHRTGVYPEPRLLSVLEEIYQRGMNRVMRDVVRATGIGKSLETPEDVVDEIRHRWIAETGARGLAEYERDAAQAWAAWHKAMQRYHYAYRFGDAAEWEAVWPEVNAAEEGLLQLGINPQFEEEVKKL